MAIEFNTLAFALLLGAVALPALAQTPAYAPSPELAAPAPAGGAVTSVAQADARLAAAALRRSEIDTRFAEREQVCYEKFFVNNCLDRAKEERRVALTGIRDIEIDASYFKRFDAVAKRDQALADSNAAADAQQRTTRPGKVPSNATPPPKIGAAARRSADQQAQAQRQQQRDGAAAARSAASTAAYDKKQRDAAERKRNVADKEAAKAAAKP